MKERFGAGVRVVKERVQSIELLLTYTAGNKFVFNPPEDC